MPDIHPFKKKKETTPIQKLQLLITVVSRNQGNYFTDLYEKYDVTIQSSILGKGTATSEILSYFGLAETEKIVIFSLIKENKLSELFSILQEEIKSHENGIAFTIPLTSIVGKRTYQFATKSLKKGENHHGKSATI